MAYGLMRGVFQEQGVQRVAVKVMVMEVKVMEKQQRWEERGDE